MGQGQVVLLRTARKKKFASYKDDKTLKETEMRQIMEEYGEVKTVRIKFDRYGFQYNREL